jgi:hypothetical protein
MTCEWVKRPNGGTAIVCGPRPRRHKCSVPGCPNNARHQCDGRVILHAGQKSTCNAWICEEHRTPAGDNVDYCPTHAKGMQLSLGI